MTFGDDADVVREYVGTSGRLDYIRMYESGTDCIAVEFSGGVARHAQALAALVEDADHVRVLAVPPPDFRPSELADDLADEYWEPRQDAVFATCEGRADIKALSFDYDDEGPFLSVGLRPYTPAAVEEATRVLAPHRIQTYEGPNAVFA